MPVIKKNTKQLRPAQTLCIGFLAIILTGALLLWLPFSSKSGGTPFFDCLFTAVSATCVTGLIVADTFTNWTVFGQVVIMLLIRLGRTDREHLPGGTAHFHQHNEILHDI